MLEKTFTKFLVNRDSPSLANPSAQPKYLVRKESFQQQFSTYRKFQLGLIAIRYTLWIRRISLA